VRGLRLGDPKQCTPYVGGRLFVDITALVRDLRLRKILLVALSGIDLGARRTLIRLLAEGRFAHLHSTTPRPERRRRKLMATLKGSLRALKVAYGARGVLRRALASLRHPEKARARARASAEAFLASIKDHTRQSSDLPSCLAALEVDMKNIPSGLTAQLVPAFMPAMFIMAVVDRWLVKRLGLAPGSGLQLMRGLPGNVTTEMNLKLWALAQTIRSDPQAHQMLLAMTAQTLAEAYGQHALPQTIQRALEEFFDQYGMRGFAELDIGRPRWRENPIFILQMLHNYLQLEDLSLAPDAVFQCGAAQAKGLKAEYLGRLRSRRFGSLRAKLLDGAIRRMQVLSVMRELPRFYFTRIIGLYRPLLLAHGQELAARGALQSAEDIFFVPVEELRRFVAGDALDLQAIVTAQRAAYDRELARKQVPRLLLSTGEIYYGEAGEADPSDLTGNAVSPGVAEGPVRVVLNPQGIRLESGEILVCPSTDPGWTPLFLMAGGLVMEMGGLVTHGSVVAREYGIPAVVGVHQATERLKTGQRVRIAGSAGRVTVLN
jgi:rifampicin phosphotransferase